MSKIAGVYGFVVWVDNKAFVFWSQRGSFLKDMTSPSSVVSLLKGYAMLVDFSSSRVQISSRWWLEQLH